MKTSDFDYELPRERIAQRPCRERDGARLLVHHIGSDRTLHYRIRDLPDILAPGDLLVLNDTRVIPVRLFGRRPSSGRVELLLIEAVPGREGAWRAWARPAGKLVPGERLELEGGALRAQLIERPADPSGDPGREWVLRLEDPAGARDDVLTLLERHGHAPLPPYIERHEGGSREEDRLDRERYQTVFARQPGAVAAPTAGLHFTPELLRRAERHGIHRVHLTLHVGPGTFLPVQVERIEEHLMHAERFVLPSETARRIEAVRRAGGRIVAVGTTSVRALESCVDADGVVVARSGETDLFLRPGSRLRVVDALLTNFHLPRSTLLMLVSALAGRERILRLYREALELGYRFYSYGDAMLLLP